MGVPEQTTLHGWGGLRLTGARLSLVLVPELGGRILSARFEDEELLFVDPETQGETPELPDAAVPLSAEGLRAAKRHLGFGLWGGDKTWVAPQAAWWAAIPPLDLDVGRYSASVDAHCAVTMTSPPCRETGLTVTRRVALTDRDEVRLAETVTNTGEAPARRGVWNVTQMLRPFDVYLPAPLDRVRAYPEEGESVALRGALLTAKGRFTRVPCRRPAHFKMGAIADPPELVALRADARGTLAHVRRFTSPPDATYAHGASVEVYNAPAHDYLEIEVHAPLALLAPGASTTLESRWSFARLPHDAVPEHALAATA